MKLIKTLLAGLTAMVVAAGFALSAQANQINGDIDFAGQVTYDTTSLATATMVTQWHMAVVSGSTGDFSGLTGSNVAFVTPYVFNPPTAYATLWSVGGFTFELDSSAIQHQDGFLLFILGSGFVSGPGFDKTPGLWSFSSNHSNGKTATSFNFSANTTAVPTPDSGSTVALLGVAIFTVGALRAKFRS
ncbi:MAG TPA: VPDSG-CTERM sorting domain-containing protein [Verrucomicrobiae bacterium]|nr:VPDSG-CTERM sorting domain-containing protein [Verrucomicrobiae bacterium]